MQTIEVTDREASIINIAVAQLGLAALYGIGTDPGITGILNAAGVTEDEYVTAALKFPAHSGHLLSKESA